VSRALPSISSVLDDELDSPELTLLLALVFLFHRVERLIFNRSKGRIPNQYDSGLLLHLTIVDSRGELENDRAASCLIEAEELKGEFEIDEIGQRVRVEVAID